MNDLYGGNLPPDFRDLLIRLDQRVADGFDTMGKKLEAMDGRVSGIDQRVSGIEITLADRPYLIQQHRDLCTKVDQLEDWRTANDARVEGAEKTLSWGRWAGGALIAILGYLGYQIEVAPTPPAHPQVQVTASAGKS